MTTKDMQGQKPGRKITRILKIPPAEKISVTAAEAAALLSMGKSTFWRELKNGNIPKAVEIGGIKRWLVSDLRRAAQPATPPTNA